MRPSENKGYDHISRLRLPRTIVVQRMSTLIFIINGGPSGQSACDCGHRRGLQGDLSQRWAPDIKVSGGLVDGAMEWMNQNTYTERETESANQFWHPHLSSGPWWQGEEEEREWRLNERVASEKWPQAAECGRLGGRWFIHGAASACCIRAVALCCRERKIEIFLCLTSQHFLKDRTSLFFLHKREGWALGNQISSPLYFLTDGHRNNNSNNNNVKTNFHCLLFAIPHIPPYPIQYFLTSLCNSFQTRAWPSYVSNQNPELRKALWQTAAWHRWKLSCAGLGGDGRSDGLTEVQGLECVYPLCWRALV